jgi:hypothetical protein
MASQANDAAMNAPGRRARRRVAEEGRSAARFYQMADENRVRRPSLSRRAAASLPRSLIGWHSEHRATTSPDDPSKPSNANAHQS